MMERDNDELCGCDVDMSADPVSDEDVPYVAMAGDLEGDEAKARIEEYGAVCDV